MRETVDDDFRPIEDYDDDPANNQERSTQELLKVHEEGVAYMNKENRPVRQQRNPPARQKRFLDRQHNAERVTWSQPEDETQPVQTKRTTGVFDEDYEEDDVSEDEGFQTDERDSDSSRRNARTAAQRAPKRARLAGDSEEREDDQQARRQQEEILQASAMASSGAQESAPPSQANSESNQGGGNNAVAAPFSQVSEVARIESAKARARAPLSKIQKRVPWSDEETTRFIDLIEEYGCRWSLIWIEGRKKRIFAENRDQIALKDKARNIKVSYLLAGLELRKNFDGIALGKKEKDKVRAAGYNPNRVEGEQVGEEAVLADRDENF